MSWSRILLIVVFADSWRALARDQSENKDHTRNRNNIPNCVLKVVLNLLKKTLESASLAKKLLTSSFGLLCRSLVTASVSLCAIENVSSGRVNEYKGAGSSSKYLLQLATKLQHAIVEVMNSHCSALDTEHILASALPLPEAMLITDNYDVKMDSKDLEVIKSLAMCACHRTPRLIHGELVEDSKHATFDHYSTCQSLSMSGIFTILFNHCPAASIVNENSAVPHPLLPLDHDIRELVFFLLSKVTGLIG